MSSPEENGAAGDGGDAGTRARKDPEQVAEEWAERIGRWVVRSAARVKEEAEDIWAEAQELRRRM